MKQYFKVHLLSTLWLFGGAVLITIMTGTANPADTNPLGNCLAFIWSFVVYLGYTLPTIEEIKAEKTNEKAQKDAEDEAL